MTTSPQDEQIIRDALAVLKGSGDPINLYMVLRGSPDMGRCYAMVEKGYLVEYGAPGTNGSKLFRVTQAGAARVGRMIF